MKKINIENNISILENKIKNYENKIKNYENKSKFYHKLLEINRFLYEDKHGFKIGDFVKFIGRYGDTQYGVILGYEGISEMDNSVICDVVTMYTSERVVSISIYDNGMRHSSIDELWQSNEFMWEDFFKEYIKEAKKLRIKMLNKYASFINENTNKS
jgi:hypothetical protein